MIPRPRAYLPWLVIGGAFALSATAILTRKAEENPPGTITLRVGHWQLESGFREGLDYAAREYQKLHPHVRIVQEAIPESTWKQWVSTQLMGGTASDILEIGNMEPNLTTSFYVRYFRPISEAVGAPNPYNKGTHLEGIPLANTFKDGMRGSFIAETQHYMNIPLSLIGIRLFYNKTLLKELTGLDTPPSDYREFLAVCDRIRAQRNNGEAYIPIAGSGWHFGRWFEMVFLPVTSSAMIDNDLNRDGRLGKEEMFAGFRMNRLSMRHPAYLGMLDLVAQVSSRFQTGYTGLTRDEALFLFAQQRALFISTGAYEARSVQHLAEGRFEIGVADFPYPSKSDPELGHLIEGPRYESADGHAQMGITRSSKHPEIALDFLLFMSGQRQNQEINRRFGWIPIIHGTTVDPELQAFEPRLEGVVGAFDPALGGETTIRWQQLFALYQVGQISRDELCRQFEDFYRDAGTRDFEEMLRNARRAYARDMQLLLGIRAMALGRPEDDPLWASYRKVLFEHIIHREVGLRLLAANAGTDGDATPAYPYRYTPAALARVKTSVR